MGFNLYTTAAELVEPSPLGGTSGMSRDGMGLTVAGSGSTEESGVCVAVGSRPTRVGNREGNPFPEGLTDDPRLARNLLSTCTADVLASASDFEGDSDRFLFCAAATKAASIGLIPTLTGIWEVMGRRLVGRGGCGGRAMCLLGASILLDEGGDSSHEGAVD